MDNKYQKNVRNLQTSQTQGTSENGKIQRTSKMKLGFDPVKRRRDILSKKKHYRTLIIFVFLVALVGFALYVGVLTNYMNALKFQLFHGLEFEK